LKKIGLKMSKFIDFCKQLENKIVSSYEEGITLEDAEKLSAEFLYAQLQVSSELKKADLDSRMRKQGVKAIRAALYTEARSKADKITEAAITAMLDANELVSGEQMAFDTAEADRDELERYYNIFNSAHVYYRQLSRGVQG
jgi:hypothetical protein